MSQVALGSDEMRGDSVARTGSRTALAFGLTTALVGFVGALVVLSIPFAILSVSLPPTVNRLGLPVAATQALLFGHPWYLLIPSTLIAVWIGFWSYRWCCRAMILESVSGEDAPGGVDQSRPSVRSQTPVEVEQSR
ncbi:MAG TPA: hypothetical protein DEP84_21425 [Chloroflexi bacterium]|nr:hypothetical protein [Chloroflexota bacterium]